MAINRFYSGFYDSVKQRELHLSVLNKTDIVDPNQRFKREYLWRLRYDIVYHGSVILTDAQFLDGLVFHLLNEAERRDLTSFMQRRIRGRYRPIEVRCRRPTVDATLSTMLGKPFVFSSLMYDRHREVVREAMGELLEGAQFSNWEDILQAVIAVTGMSSVKQLKEEISALKEVIEKSQALVPWGASSVFVQKWEELAKQLHEEVEAYMVAEGGSGQEKPEEARNYPLMYFLATVHLNTVVRTESSQKPIYPDRSAVDSAYRRAYSERGLLPEQKEVIDTVSEKFWKAYNSAIAAQHRAEDIDIGESEAADVLENAKPDFSLRWRKFGLEEPSWDEFWESISRSREWNEWMEYRLQSAQAEPQNIEKMQEKLFRFLSRTFPARQGDDSPIWGGGSDLFKHRVRGFLSQLVGRTKRVFSKIEFSFAVYPFNPTVILTFKKGQ